MHDLIPIFICAIMPMVCVAFYYLSEMNKENKRTEVISKAIESSAIDPEKLTEALRKPQKTPLQILNRRLLLGCIFTLLGVLLIVIGAVGLMMGAEFVSDQVTVPMVFGGIGLAIGLSYLIVYFVTRKQVTDDKK